MYAADVMFKQSYNPSGSFQDGKIYFNRTLKLYWHKTAAFVLPIILAINQTNEHPKSVSDLNSFQNIWTFTSMLQIKPT